MFEVGYVGLFFASFLAATIIPFSSDTIVVTMVALGYDAFQTIAIATIGNTLGGLSSYGLGWLGKWDWIEKYLKIKKEKIEKMRQRIQKYTGLAAFLTWLPFIGDVIAVTLGFLKINFFKVAIFMTTGKLARYIVIVYLWDIFF
ncbi:MAG: hypothetical protein COX07_00715 [Bacteroidetes bacterium CG23_combo_of_CG06-09_8_20_14_all_32_9]|nr:MAG: hypothetical protein COX07_00715 [Bacteroidetes bacterium CG23_combo_of_CG06-09_8_20_14_all_32_9]